MYLYPDNSWDCLKTIQSCGGNEMDNKKKNKEFIKQQIQKYGLNYHNDEAFLTNILQADYNLESIQVADLQIPVLNQTIRQNFYYIQSYSHGGMGSKKHFTRRTNLESYLLAYTLKGQGELVYEDRSYLLNPGDCFFIDCRKPHYYRTLDENGWSYDPIHLGGNHLGDLYAIFAEYGNPVVSIGLHSPLSHQLEKLWEIAAQNTLYSELQTHQILTNLISEFIMLHHFSECKSIPTAIKEIQHYISQHYADPITLDFLAEHMHLSKFYISHEFKRYTGTSVMEYVKNMRINVAKTLLTGTDLPVYEIALQIGFNYSNYFYRVFQEMENTTPIQYRKQWKHLEGERS